MSAIEIFRRGQASRRGLLRGAVLATGGVVLAAVAVGVAGEAVAATKMSQKAAGYRNKPLGRSQCDGCALWQPPAACKMVEGAISPTGWCNLFNAK